MSIVDGMDIPVGEKVLRLQRSLTGKALTLVTWNSLSMPTKEQRKNSKRSMEERGVCKLNT